MRTARRPSLAFERAVVQVGTITEKTSHLNHHIVPAFGSRSLDTITTRDVDRFSARLEGQGLSRNTVANILITLRHMLRVAKRWEYVDEVPEVSARKVRPDKLERDHYLDAAELDAFLSAAEPEWQPVLLLLVRTGIRTGECRALAWTDVDLEAKRLYVRRGLTRHGMGTPKANKGGYVPIAWDLAELLEDLPHRGATVFVGEDGGPLAINAIERACKRAAKAAKLKC